MGTTLRALLIAAVALSAGCATKPPATTTTLPFDDYRDATEYFFPTSRLRSTPTAGTTYYIQTDSRRICYAFDVPGTWERGRELAVLRRADGGAVVGVLLMSVRELGASSVHDAIRRAAENSDEIYRLDEHGLPSRLAPDPGVPGTWRWEVPVDLNAERGRVARIIPRWYLPVGDDWIAQFTIGHPSDTPREAFAERVVRSLTTSRERRCYEARLRELGLIRAR